METLPHRLGFSGMRDEDDPGLPVEGVGFCADQPWCATCGQDGAVRVWDLTAATQPQHDTSLLAAPRFSLQHDEAAVSLAWRGPTLYSASVDGTLRVWDAHDPRISSEGSELISVRRD